MIKRKARITYLTREKEGIATAVPREGANARPRAIILGLVAILLLGVVTAFTLPYFLGPDYIQSFFLQQIEQSLGRKIEVGQARLKVFPRIQLVLFQVVVRDLDPSRVFLKAKRCDLVLRILPLLRQRVVGKRLTIEELQVELRRDQTGHWNFLSFPDTGGTKDQADGNPLAWLLLVRETTLINGEVTLVDESRPDGVRSIRMSAVDAVTSVRPDGNRADVQVSAMIPDTQGVSALSLAGRVNRTEPPLRMAQEDATRAVPVFQFEGTTQATNIHLRQVADFFGPRPVPDRIRGSANLRGLIRVVPGVAGYDMVLSEMKANFEHLSLSGQASVSGLMTAQPTFSLTFSSSALGLDDLLNLVPAQWVHPQLPTIIKEREIKGTVEAVSATITGSASPQIRLSLIGEFRVQQGHVLVGRDRTPAQNMSGTVFIEPGRIRVADMTGGYGPMRVSSGKALVSFLDAGPWLEMELTGDMAAADLVALLAKTVPSERLSHALAELREVEGIAFPTFRIVGPLNKPAEVTFAGGEFVARNISFRSPALPDPVLGLHGRLLLSPNGTEFDKLGGQFGQTRFEVQGTIAGGKLSTFQGFTVRARTDASQLVQLLPTGPPLESVLQGTIGVAAVLTGPTSAPQIQGELGLTDAKLVLPGIGEKPAGAPTSIEFDGTLSRDATLWTGRGEVVLPSLRLAAKGKMQLGRQFGLEGALVTGPISLASLPDWITLEGLEAGTLEISLDVKGQGKDWRTWQTTGWVALTNGLFLDKRLDGPVKDLYLRLKLVRNGAELKRLTFRVNESDASLSGVIRNWHTRPTITMKVESSQLDIDLLIPKGARSRLRDMLETLAESTRLVATVSVDRGAYKQFLFSNLSCRVNIGDGVLDVDRISGHSDGGNIAGRLVLQLPKQKPADAEVSVRLTGVPFEEFTHLFGTKEHLIVGDLRLSGTLRGNGRDPQGVPHSLSGRTNLLIEQGRILQSKVIWKILGILNLPALLQGQVDVEKDGLPFDKISATILVRNGRIESENIAVNSPVLKITAAGNYDLPTDQLDFVVAVSPFGSYSQLLKSIPLFGKLLAGDRKGLATALFQVKGPLQEPDVTYMPLRSLAAGLSGLAQLALDVLKNTLMLPKEMIDSSDNEAPVPETSQTPELSAPPSP